MIGGSIIKVVLREQFGWEIKKEKKFLFPCIMLYIIFCVFKNEKHKWLDMVQMDKKSSILLW